MRAEIHGIGWFVRRSADPQALGEFYRDIVGFPELRNYGPTKMLWMGETVDLEPGAGGTLLPASRAYQSAPCLPVIQSRSITETKDRLKRALVLTVGEENGPDGTIAWFLDPAGNSFGVTERPVESADQIWEPDPANTVGGARLAPDLVRLGFVIRRCADVARVAAFYRDVVGLRKLEVPEKFDLGGGTTLQLRHGGAVMPLPADRYEAIDAFIIRLDDVDSVVADLARQGTPVVNQPFDIEGGRIAYVADPEGQVLGVQTRQPNTNRIEDHEAFRRRFSR